MYPQDLEAGPIGLTVPRSGLSGIEGILSSHVVCSQGEKLSIPSNYGTGEISSKLNRWTNKSLQSLAICRYPPYDRQLERI
jgi:hypothetical protein